MIIPDYARYWPVGGRRLAVLGFPRHSALVSQLESVRFRPVQIDQMGLEARAVAFVSDYFLLRWLGLPRLWLMFGFRNC